MAFSEFSSVGKKKLGVHGTSYAGLWLCYRWVGVLTGAAVLLIVLDVIALALAARVNIFQEFYCECPPTRVSRARQFDIGWQSWRTCSP